MDSPTSLLALEVSLSLPSKTGIPGLLPRLPIMWTLRLWIGPHVSTEPSPELSLF